MVSNVVKQITNFSEWLSEAPPEFLKEKKDNNNNNNDDDDDFVQKILDSIFFFKNQLKMLISWGLPDQNFHSQWELICLVCFIRLITCWELRECD